MSRKSVARQAAKDRAFAYQPTDRKKVVTDPLLPRFVRVQRQAEQAREEIAASLGYQSVEEMDADMKLRRDIELRLPVTAGIDRSHQYLATQLLRERDGNHCYLCQRDMTGLKAVVEHIIPIGQGGLNEPHNVALACPECNSRKGGNYVSLTVSSGAPVYHLPR